MVPLQQKQEKSAHVFGMAHCWSQAQGSPAALRQQAESLMLCWSQVTSSWSSAAMPVRNLLVGTITMCCLLSQPGCAVAGSWELSSCKAERDSKKRRGSPCVCSQHQAGLQPAVLP